MQAIEFETVPQHHTIQLPEGVPDGIPMRVVLLWESVTPPKSDVKALFTSAIEGLTDEDLRRPKDLGREDSEWGI
jgi:hypothetical protein